MKSVLQKIALIALIFAGAIFIVLMFTVSSWAEVDEAGAFISPLTNPIVLVFLIILCILFGGLSVYLLWSVFSEDENVKRILLYRDGNSTAKTTYSVAKKMIAKSAKQLGSVRIKKVQIRQVDNTFVLNVGVLVKAEEIEHEVDTLRCMISDVFYNVLGIKFDSINFEVKKVVNNYKPDLQVAEIKADEIKAQRVAKQALENSIPEEKEEIEAAAELLEAKISDAVEEEIAGTEEDNENDKEEPQKEVEKQSEEEKTKEEQPQEEQSEPDENKEN